MIKISPDQFEVLLPLAVKWAEAKEKVILELKSVERILPVHKKQLLTYLKLTNLKLGYLINFGSPIMKEGITRLINGRL